MKQLGESLGSRRFRTFAIAWAGLLGLAALILVLKADSGLAGTVLLPLVTFASSAIGFGAWHDRAVRAALATTSNAPGSAPGGEGSSTAP